MRSRTAVLANLFAVNQFKVENMLLLYFTFGDADNTADFLFQTRSSTDVFTLTVLSNLSSIRRMSNGATVGLDSAVRQDYAGGVNTVDWDLTGACSSDYAFTTEIPSATERREGTFSVVSVNTRLSPVSQQEVFTLYPGEAKVLRDSTKIIYRDVVREEYAGGIHGFAFELICS